jgi:hypothetical protein
MVYRHTSPTRQHHTLPLPLASATLLLLLLPHPGCNHLEGVQWLPVAFRPGPAPHPQVALGRATHKVSLPPILSRACCYMHLTPWCLSH